MLERILILTKLQLRNKTRTFAKNSKRIYAFVALRILAVVLITVAIGLLLNVIKNYVFIPINDYFMIFILILTQALSIAATLSGLSVDIYQSKDNQILLTLPAKNDEIFLSKLIVYYINEFMRNFYFLFPFLIAYGFVSSMGFSYFASIIPTIVLLPFIAVFLSAILSIVINVVNFFLSKHTWLTFALIIVTITLFFTLVYYLVGFLPDNIRIVQLYSSFIVGLTKFMQQVASYGLIYTTFGRLLNGDKVLINYLIVIGFTLGLFIINYLVSRPLFFILTSHSNEQARTITHKIKKEKRKGIFWTFLRKEIIIAKRSPNELINNYTVLIFLPVIMYVLNSIYMRMDRSSIGNSMVLIFNILITLILITAANTASAVAITTEGNEFVLLKTAPSKTKHVAWAKMAFNIVFTSFLLLLSFVLFSLALPVFNQTDIWLLFIFIFFINISQILWAFQLDVVNPRLSDYASTGSLSNNSNVAKSISNGLSTTLVLIFTSIILFIFFDSIAWYVLIAMAIIWFIFRLKTFIAYLDAYFIDIEY
jgi:ABC-2 type transport system permease protein